MASFPAKFVLFFVAVMLFCAKVEGTQNQKSRVKKGIVPYYLMKLYTIWASRSNQTGDNKLPFNSTAVRAMHFSSIRSKMS